MRFYSSFFPSRVALTFNMVLVSLILSSSSYGSHAAKGRLKEGDELAAEFKRAVHVSGASRSAVGAGVTGAAVATASDTSELLNDNSLSAIRSALKGKIENSNLPPALPSERGVPDHMRGYGLLRPTMEVLASFEPYDALAHLSLRAKGGMGMQVILEAQRVTDSLNELHQVAHRVLTLAAHYWPVETSSDDSAVLATAKPLPSSLSMAQLWGFAYAHLLVLQPEALPSLERGAFLRSVQQGVIRRSDLWPRAFSRLVVTTMMHPGQIAPVFMQQNFRIFQPCARLLGEAPEVRKLIVGGGSTSGYSAAKYYSINMLSDGEDGTPDAVALGTVPEPLEYFPNERFEEIVFNHISEAVILEAANGNETRLGAVKQYFRMLENGGILTFLTNKLPSGLPLEDGVKRKAVETVLEKVGFTGVTFKKRRTVDQRHSYILLSAVKPHSSAHKAELKKAYQAGVLNGLYPQKDTEKKDVLKLLNIFKHIQDYYG